MCAMSQIRKFINTIWFILIIFSTQLKADEWVNYMLNCAGCHKPDGTGAVDVPSLENQMAKFLSVPGGREFLVSVPGTAQSPLSDSDTANLLNWMLVKFSEAEMPKDFSPYTANDVSAYRTALVDVSKKRKLLIGLIEAKLLDTE